MFKVGVLGVPELGIRKLRRVVRVFISSVFRCSSWCQTKTSITTSKLRQISISFGWRWKNPSCGLRRAAATRMESLGKGRPKAARSPTRFESMGGRNQTWVLWKGSCSPCLLNQGSSPSVFKKLKVLPVMLIWELVTTNIVISSSWRACLVFHLGVFNVQECRGVGRFTRCRFGILGALHVVEWWHRKWQLNLNIKY